jgi:branched-chain amino acid transport system permease protein
MLLFIQQNRVIILTIAIVVLVLGTFAQGLEARVSASIILSGVTLAAIIFLIASGLSLIFGLMHVLNFAHGAIFVFGAYVGLTTFSNPRLLFNTIPFFLAITSGIILANHFGVHFWRKVQSKDYQQLMWWFLLALAAGIILIGLRSFPIARLNAFHVTAVGGAVPTALAQESIGLMVQRIAMVFLGGLPLGVILAPREPRLEGRTKPLHQIIAMTVGLLLVGFLILFVRDPGETYWLGMSSDIRFALAILFGASGGALVGIFIEMKLIRPFYGSPVTQLVLTLGLSIVMINLIEEIWGKEGHPPMQPPSIFNEPCRSDTLIAWFTEHCRSIDVLGRAFPTYRLFIIAVGIAVFIAVVILLKHTRIGIIIRAGVQDSEMVQALGINVRRVFTFVFALGSATAALGGVIIAPFMGVYPAVGSIFLLQAFISVVIGGMGSFTGAAIGTLLLGLARAFGDHFVAAGIQLPFTETIVRGSPAIARASTVLIMAIVLLVRPAGIFGKKE